MDLNLLQLMPDGEVPQTLDGAMQVIKKKTPTLAGEIPTRIPTITLALPQETNGDQTTKVTPAGGQTATLAADGE
jgi:hypothetical protein